jgi:hypothetical protein
VSVWCSKFKDGQMALNDNPEKYRDRSSTLHTDLNRVTGESFIREDQRV